MECNKDEAVRAKETAERKMVNKDFEGARKIASRAQNLYPELENISQILSICDVHCSAQKMMLGSERDWYGILQVERFSDELTIKKQYRRLALILHPDKNRFPGAEAAFKLICEANAVLSDITKKSLYDSKIRVLSRPSPVNQPPYCASKKSQLNKQYGGQNNVANGFSNLNQHQATWSSSSVGQDVFWTYCPFCSNRYQYQREFVNKSLRCTTCYKFFMACEISVQNAPLGPKWNQPGAHMPSNPCSSQSTFFYEKVVPNQNNFKTNVHHKGFSASRAAAQGIGNMKTVRPGSNRQSEVGPDRSHVASGFKESGNLKANATDSHNTPCMPGGKDDKKPNGIGNKGEPEMKNKRRKVVDESSESCDTSSDSDLEDSSGEGNVADPTSSDSDLEDSSGEGTVADPANDPSSGPCGVRPSRRSLRRKQHISYIESDGDDDDDDFFSSPLKRSKASENSEVGKEEPKDGEDSKNSNQNNSPADEDFSKSECKETETVHAKVSLKDNGNCDGKEGQTRGKPSDISGNDAETVKTSDSDTESLSTDNVDESMFDCPDAEFNDFDSLRDENQFKVNQIWACYDEFDNMPRFYAKVKKASACPFEVSMTWLEPVPINEHYKGWVDEELPVGCGTFELGGTQVTTAPLTFSHQVHFDKGQRRGSLIIYPRKGDVWALIKDWDMNWSLDPENHKEFKYEIVEVLSDFVSGAGIKVNYLDKVEGFVSLFHRSSQSETTSYMVGPNELYKFSHCVPSFKMTGFEREGVPAGSFELDPASLPLNLDNLYYPGKVKMEKGNMDSGV